MAAGSRTQILLLSQMCDIVTSQTRKVDKRKPVEQEDIEKKVGIPTFRMAFQPKQEIQLQRKVFWP